MQVMWIGGNLRMVGRIVVAEDTLTLRINVLVAVIKLYPLLAPWVRALYAGDVDRW